jgi:hypothetical protein
MVNGDMARSELDRLTEAAEALLGEPVLAAGYFRPMNLRVQRAQLWPAEIQRWLRAVTTQEPRLRHLPKITVVVVTDTRLAVLAPEHRTAARAKLLLGPWSLPARHIVAAGSDEASLRVSTADGRSVDLQGLLPTEAAASVVRAVIRSGR